MGWAQAILAQVTGPWASTTRAKFLTDLFNGKQGIIQVFEAFDWPHKHLWFESYGEKIDN